MEERLELRLHVELDVQVDGAQQLETYAREQIRDQLKDDPEALEEALDDLEEDLGNALQAVVDPDDLVSEIPGVLPTGATWWAEVTPQSEAKTVSRSAATPNSPAMGEDEIVQNILQSAEQMAGIELERLGYNESETDPSVRGESLRRARALAGAMGWAYEILVDELFTDVCKLRENPDSVQETFRISALPPMYRLQYGPLFTQKFLAVAIGLGTDMATSFRSPTCVAQELALRLVLDGVEVLADIYPGLALPEHWRGQVEDALFEDMDHEMLYDPALDGISSDSNYAHLGIADLDPSSWFVPFSGRSVNPYAAD